MNSMAIKTQSLEVVKLKFLTYQFNKKNFSNFDERLEILEPGANTDCIIDLFFQAF